jgi:hypothetical protein
MGQKSKDIIKVMEKIKMGKGTIWNIRQVAGVLKDFKNSEAFSVIEWWCFESMKQGLSESVNGNLKNNSHDFWRGYDAGLLKVFNYIDDTISGADAADDKYKMEQAAKKEQHDDVSDVPQEPEVAESINTIV